MQKNGGRKVLSWSKCVIGVCLVSAIWFSKLCFEVHTSRNMVEEMYFLSLNM